MAESHTEVPSKTAKGGGIVDDFMYGSNVATAHVYIRLGKHVVSNAFFRRHLCQDMAQVDV